MHLFSSEKRYYYNLKLKLIIIKYKLIRGLALFNFNQFLNVWLQLSTAIITRISDR